MGLSAAHPQLSLVAQAQPWHSPLAGRVPSCGSEEVECVTEVTCWASPGKGNKSCCFRNIPWLTQGCSPPHPPNTGEELPDDAEPWGGERGKKGTKRRKMWSSEWQASAFLKCLSTSPRPTEGHRLPYLFPEGHIRKKLKFQQPQPLPGFMSTCHLQISRIAASPTPV